MKKKLLLILFSIFMLCSCDLQDNFDDVYLYTTSYPIEYAVKMIFNDYANISSVYPNGADTTYEVTEKKKDKYSQAETFVYSGISGEAYLARDLLNKNSKLQIIDATKGVSINSDYANVWLDPSNYLMLCSNIKSSLIEYNDNTYVKKSIEENYKELNEKISELDVQLYDIGKNGNYNTILTTNGVLSYLTKYNINVISIDEDSELLDKSYAEAKKLIDAKKIKYIYYLSGDKLTENQEKLISSSSLVKVEINDLFTLTDEERTKGDDYISLMNEIIDNYKKELYKN